MDDNITVKVSGTAVYKAVKNYLDNSPEMQKTVAELVAKHLEAAIKNRITSMMHNLEGEARYRLRTELDTLVKKEVESKVATLISKGIAKMFEGEKS